MLITSYPSDFPNATPQNGQTLDMISVATKIHIIGTKAGRACIKAQESLWTWVFHWRSLLD